MKFLFDFFPIVLFFIAYKLFDIYNATAIAMGASLLQVILYRVLYQRYEKLHLYSLLVIFILGGATLFFHDPLFIKWKPTGIYWITALLFLLSSFLTKKPIIQRMMDANISLPAVIWQRLNYAWAVFFIIMGAVNLYVAYHFSTDIWVNFKLFGGAGFTLLFVILQATYLSKHIIEKNTKSSPEGSS